jgi:hypothetical protein
MPRNKKVQYVITEMLPERSEIAAVCRNRMPSVGLDCPQL